MSERYALVKVHLATGEATTVAKFFGEEGADLAYNVSADLSGPLAEYQVFELLPDEEV